MCKTTPNVQREKKFMFVNVHTEKRKFYYRCNPKKDNETSICKDVLDDIDSRLSLFRIFFCFVFLRGI